MTLPTLKQMLVMVLKVFYSETRETGKSLMWIQTTRMKIIQPDMKTLKVKNMNRLLFMNM